MPARKYSKRSYTYSSKLRAKSKRGKTIKKYFKLTLTSIIGLVLFSVAFYLYSLTMVIKQPFAKASSLVDLNEKAYNSQNNFSTLLIKLSDKNDSYSNIESLHYYYINQNLQKSILIEIPVEMTVDYNSSIGEVQVKKIFASGNFGDEDRGVEMVKNFVKKSLAISVDSYVVYDNELVESLSEIQVNINKDDLGQSIKYKYFLKLPEFFSSIRSQLYSDLSSVEAIKLITDSKKVSSKNYLYKKLDESFFSDNLKFDEFWQQTNEVNLNSNYRSSVIILNSTSTPGMASFFARVVKNIGGIVLEVGNYEQQQFNETKIYLNNDDANVLSQYVAKTLGFSNVLNPSEFEGDASLIKRSDILIIVGKDGASRF